MKKQVLTLFLLLLIGPVTFGQTNQCGTDEMHQRLYYGFPGIHDKVIENSKQLEEFTTQYIANINPLEKGTISFVIPVVFHVIHNYGQENIDNDQILDQLRIINEDFQKRNADTIDIIPEFQPIAADCEIEFRLAQIDPDGNCTSGITRHQDARTYIGDHSVKEIVHWDPSMYLNIYICSAAAGLAGHAIVPAAADTISEWDGIVIASTSVGSIGTSSPTTSVVLTHEIGHYLNLQHVWGGNNVPGYPYLPVGNAGNCAYDDEVVDTPNTIGWQSCGLGNMSCGDLDNIQNFMEYAYCPAMFTEGQKLRMHATLNSTIANRNNLWSAGNLIATGVDSPSTLCEVDFSQDKTYICAGESIQFKDISYNGVDAWSWEFEGGTPSVSNDTNPLIQYNTPGVYQVKLVSSNGGISDSIIKTEWIEVFNTTSLAENLLESFQGYSNLNNDRWYVDNPDGGIAWELDSTTGYNSNRCAKLHNYNNGIKNEDALVSKPIDISNVNDIELSFKYAFAKRTSSNLDRLQVSVSKDCGETWVIRKQLSASSLNTLSDTLDTEFVPNGTGEWKSAVVTSISSSYWTDNFMVKFALISDGGNNVYIDNIMLLDPATTNIEEVIHIESSIFPNPSDGNIAIHLAQPITAPTFTLSDLSGKTVFKSVKNASGSKFQLDVEELSNGVYLLNTLVDNRIINAKKVILKK